MNRSARRRPSHLVLARALSLTLASGACASSHAPELRAPERPGTAQGADSPGLSPVGVWEERTTLGPVVGASVTFDRARKVILLFGGLRAPGQFLADTWQWDGVRWLRLHPQNFPPARAFGAMAFDEVRATTVLFSGTSFNPSNDTWEWDGTTWSAAGTGAKTIPAAREYPRMTFDPTAKKVLLFGGFSLKTQAVVGDTWTWDGASWTNVAEDPGLESPAMAVDRARGQTLRFGGIDPTYQRVDTTAVWSGTSWMTLHPTVAPSGRAGAALAFDEGAGELVLWGGRDANAALGDGWSWDGGAWSQIPASVVPPPRQEAAMAWDGARVVLAGGYADDDTILDDTWLWEGGTWSKIPASNPVAAEHAGLAFDERRQRVVLFGGTDGVDALFADTWEWDGDWKPMSPAHSPPARYGHGMSYDAARGLTVMFGGRTNSGELGDTWTWDGIDWHEATPPHAPAPRWAAAMTYDHLHQLTILHGGSAASSPVPGDETWQWDGFDWEKRPVKGPGARSQHAMADDRAGHLVLFGGSVGLESNDTWVWDGAAWSLASPSTAPTARSFPAMAFDPFRKRVVLFGGLQPGTQVFSDVWEWDGAEWHEVTAPGGPGPIARAAFTFVDGERAALLFGGEPADPAPVVNGTWLYRARSGSCTTDDQCDTPYCAVPPGVPTGVCCEQASCPVCYACDTEADPGHCAPEPASIACGRARLDCSDGLAKRSSCDGAGTCVVESLCTPYTCQNSADCETGLTCSADLVCVTDTPFPPPVDGCAVEPPPGDGRRRLAAALAALAMLALAAARRARPKSERRAVD